MASSMRHTPEPDGITDLGIAGTGGPSDHEVARANGAVAPPELALIKERTGGVAHLWDEYRSNPTRECRDRLILHYSSLVKYVAGRVSAGLPSTIDRSDLASYGIFGLIDAIERFEPERGLKFETYAMARIKGAILDELRGTDWVPRSVRAKARALEEAYATLEAQLHRTPTEAELAASMGITEEQLAEDLSQISFRGIVALDEMLSAGAERGDTGVTLGDTIADSGDGPVQAFEETEMRRILADAIGRMGERERIVLTLYYYEGLTMAEIGEVIGVTESRVCQIHTSSVLQLRSRIAAAERELA